MIGAGKEKERSFSIHLPALIYPNADIVGLYCRHSIVGHSLPGLHHFYSSSLFHRFAPVFPIPRSPVPRPAPAVRPIPSISAIKPGYRSALAVCGRTGLFTAPGRACLAWPGHTQPCSSFLVPAMTSRPKCLIFPGA